MLVEFRTENFRSIRDEESICLIANSSKELSENTIETSVSAIPRLLKSSVIYGANAAGKSNFLMGLQRMKNIVLMSSQLAPEQTFNFTPFLLDDKAPLNPMFFEVTVLLSGIRYQYGFAINEERVLEEYLYVYKTSQRQKWFEREWDDERGEEKYYFGPGFTGQKSKWKELTKKNTLFITVAATYNSSDLSLLFQWFSNLIIVNENERLNAQFSVKSLEDETTKRTVEKFLRNVDISIKEIRIEEREVQSTEFTLDRVKMEKSEVVHKNSKQKYLKFVHSSPNGEHIFDLQDESAGTKSLLFTLCPIIDVLRRGGVFVVDELDSSMHPLLVQSLIMLFHSKVNQKGAQLIFSAHDTILLDSGLFRRDQVWLMDKDSSQSSHLIPMTDFKPRKKEVFGKGYLGGKYGGIALIGDILEDFEI